MKYSIKVSKCISKRILTSKDLSDYYAFIERYGDEITYDWETEEQDRIEKLMCDINYVQGVYDSVNVYRILMGE